MKKFFCRFVAVALALAFVGCSNEELNDENTTSGGSESKDAVYMNVTVQLPVRGIGSRSETGEPNDNYVTSTGGTEEGLDRENVVNNILLVLADKSNKFIGCAEKSESLTKDDNNGTITTVQSISKSVLAQYYGGDEGIIDAEKQKINVFVFCNPTASLREIFETSVTKKVSDNWYDEVCSISEEPDKTNDNETIWGGPNHDGGFLMSSSTISTKKIPAKFTDWENFTDINNPFKLSENNLAIGGDEDNEIKNEGAIKVERSVARFDFRDGSKNKDNTYDIVKVKDNNSDATVMQIKLTKMSLVNMSKNFYYLRRVSSDGSNTDVSLCGTETSTNYVVDTDAGFKRSTDFKKLKNTDYPKYFNFCLGDTLTDAEWAINANARYQWFTSEISEILEKGENDNPNWGGTAEYGDYKIWRYVTENTIPSIEKQQNGISTGIIFKGQMIAAKDATGTLADALNNVTGIPANDPILYTYGNNIFVSWTEIRAKAIEQGKGDPMYKVVFGESTVDPQEKKEDGTGITIYSNDEKSVDYLWNEWYNHGKNSDQLKEFKKAATAANFTLYESSIDHNIPGYYCYYFYWNRHNDNHNNGVMGPMEFGVVRNNVYKLAVTNIHKLGHPRISENDPDPVNPDDPDEDGDVYLSVSVEVLPWVVRINDIEF